MKDKSNEKLSESIKLEKLANILKALKIDAEIHKKGLRIKNVVINDSMDIVDSGSAKREFKIDYFLNTSSLPTYLGYTYDDWP